MVEILEKQQLEVENLLSFRGNITQNDLKSILLEMKTYIEGQGANVVEKAITATFSLSSVNNQEIMDIEILLPISQKIRGTNKFTFKDKIKITNAVMIRHFGEATSLHLSCEKLNAYILNCNYTPLTVGYTHIPKNHNLNNQEIDFYVGISPNIL